MKKLSTNEVDYTRESFHLELQVTLNSDNLNKWFLKVERIKILAP